MKQPIRMIMRPDKVVIIYDLLKRITRHRALFIDSRHLVMTIAVNAEEDTVLEIPHFTLLRRLEDGRGGGGVGGVSSDSALSTQSP